MLGAVIHDDIDNQTAARARTRAYPIHLLCLDESPLTAGTPIFIKLIKRILRVFSRMFRPIGIVHPDGVCRVVVLLLESLEEVTNDRLSTPIWKSPDNECHDEERDDGRGNRHFAPACFCRIVLLSVEQSHDSLAYMDTARLV